MLEKGEWRACGSFCAREHTDVGHFAQRSGRNPVASSASRPLGLVLVATRALSGLVRTGRASAQRPGRLEGADGLHPDRLPV